MIHMTLPGVPPTTNHAYINRRDGGRALSEEGRRYKLETPAYLHRHYREELKFFTKCQNRKISVALCFRFLEVENKGWPKKAKARYKKLDLSNRVKLFEDCLSQATGIDDSQIFSLSLMKLCAQEHEETLVWFWDPEVEDSPFDRVFRELLRPYDPPGDRVQGRIRAL